ncbi:hypothetical protein [Aquirufa nivalisilvae]
MVEKISANVYVVHHAKSSIGVTFGNAHDSGYDGMTGSSKSAEYVPFGVDDKMLQQFHQICTSSPNKWPLLKTKRDFMLGRGIDILTKTVKDGKKEYVLENDQETIQIEEFLENIGYYETLKAKAMDICFASRYFVKISLSPLPLKVEKYERVDPFHCRPKKMSASDIRINTYVLNANFGKADYKKSENVEIPAYDPENPTAYPVFILDVRDIYPGQTYHPIAEWWGTKDWTEVTNKIPKFHSSGLDNGYNIKYHISVPDNYFEKDSYPEGYNEERLKKEVLDNIGETLSGIDNVDKTLFTFHKVLSEGRYAESGIKIIPLENKMSDDAYTSLFTTANTVQASGHRVLPVLAGIDTGGKLGGSGKELEAAANFQQGFLTYSDRELLLADFQVIKKINGWNRNKVAMFEDIKLYTYDVTPSQATQNPNNNAN